MFPAAVALAQDAAAEEPAGEPAQADSGSESAGDRSDQIEPYEGEPIYLPESEPPPPPKQVDSQVVKINQPNSEAPLLEKRLILFSDNSFKSDGLHKEFFTSGKLFVEGQYALGRPVGEWTYYHENGNVAKVVNYADGLPDGDVEFRDESGRLLKKRSYKNGKRHGAWYTYSDETEEEQPVFEQNYEEGKPEGLWRTWYKNGQLKQEIQFKNGQRDGLAKEWTSAGEQRIEANFKEGKNHGKMILWQRGGRVIEREYNEGLLVQQSTREES